MIAALDFDGVLFNTCYDNLINAFNSYLELFPDTKIFYGKRLHVKDLKKIKRSETTRRFQRYMIYTRCAEELILVYYAIDNEKKIAGFKDTDDLRRMFSEKKLLSWRKLFYKNRYKLQKEKGWHKINMPYKKALSRAKDSSLPIYIVTNKDRRTVKLLLDKYGLKVKGIMDKDISIDKSEKFKKLTRKLNIIPENIYFVDDNLEHILKVRKLKVSCFLASWGYNTAEDITLAKNKKIRVIDDLEDVV